LGEFDMQLQQPNATIQEVHWQTHLLNRKVKEKGRRRRKNKQSNKCWRHNLYL